MQAAFARYSMLMYTTTSNAQTIERRYPQVLDDSNLNVSPAWLGSRMPARVRHLLPRSNYWLAGKPQHVVTCLQRAPRALFDHVA